MSEQSHRRKLKPVPSASVFAAQNPRPGNCDDEVSLPTFRSCALTCVPHLVYVKGRHISYQRGKRNTNPGTSLLQLEGVDSSEAAQWYAGKRVAYVYRAQRSVRGSKIRVIWGKVTRPHGSYIH